MLIYIYISFLNTCREPVKKDTSPVKTVKPPPQSPVEPEKKTPELPPVQTKPTHIPQPISRPTPIAEPDEHVLKLSSKVDKPAEKKKDSFIEFERLQQSRVEEGQAAPPATDEPTEEYQIEDEEIESIVEDILNCEDDLPEEESDKYADDDLQKKIREHLKALQEQENQFQYQTPSQILKSAEAASSQAQQKPSTQLKYASEEFEKHVEDEE